MFTTFTIKVYGRVQGVFYRQSTQTKALEFNITGTVKNCEDGSVEIVASGETENVKQLIEWCRQGPKRAKVDRVDIHEHPLKNYDNFIITY